MPTKVNFSYKTIAKPSRGKLLDKIIQEQSKRLFQSTKMIREELDNNAKIQVTRQNDFFASLRKAYGKLDATQLQEALGIDAESLLAFESAQGNGDGS